MTRKRWDRKTYKYAGFISIVAALVLSKLFIFAPVIDVLSGMAAFFLFLLLTLLPIVFFIGWALKNESRQGGRLQAIGFALIYGGLAFLWFALWNPQATWEFPIPLLAIAAIYIAAIILCFVFAVPPGRR